LKDLKKALKKNPNKGMKKMFEELEKTVKKLKSENK